MLQLNNIVLKYSYKTVLSGVSLNLENGKIYSLLGENGAGKSTLAGIICGDRIPDSGSIFVDSVKQKFRLPKDAIEKGIMCVHQRPILCEQISIKENFLLGSKKIDTLIAQKLLTYFLPERKLNTIVRELSLGERFFVSLIGILLKNPSFLILDEPSALLDENQIKILFDYLHSSAKNGITVLLITHFIKEALIHSDYVILLKNGVVEKSLPSSQNTEKEIIETLYKGIETEEFTESEAYKEFLNNPFVSCIKIKNVKDFIKKEQELCRRYNENGEKCGIIPSDRTFTASNPKLTVFQICTALKNNLSSQELELFCLRLLKRSNVNIKPFEKAENLSGGMLQRIILERELLENPQVMILCEPFQGLDFLASRKLFEKLNDFISEPYFSEKNGEPKHRKIIILESDK